MEYKVVKIKLELLRAFQRASPSKLIHVPQIFKTLPLQSL